jgi:hypothetical protein
MDSQAGTRLVQILRRQIVATAERAVAQTQWSAIYPSSPRRGGCAIDKKSRSILSSRRRGGVQPQQTSVEFEHHPVRSIEEASRYFVDVASTPPRRGGENCGPLRFGQQPRKAAVRVSSRTRAPDGEGVAGICRTYGAYRVLPKPRACARGYDLSPLRGSNRVCFSVLPS